MDTTPDLVYAIELIGDAYCCVCEAIEQNKLEQAEFWLQELSLLVQGLERYYHRML